MSGNKLVLSASSLKTFKQCGRKFHLYKIKKAQPTHEPFHYGWVGTIVHNSIYYSIADYISGSWNVAGPKSWTAVENFFDDLWEGQASMEVSRHLIEDGEVSKDRPYFRPGSMKDKKYQKSQFSEVEQWKNLSRDLVRTGYHLMVNNIIPGYEEIRLEHKLEFDFDNRMGILGFVDILCKKESGHWHFYDLKTSRRAPQYLDTDIQFYLYRYGLKNTFNLNYYPEGHYVHLRSKKVKRVDSNLTEDFEYNENQIHTLIDGIEQGNWEPNLYQVLCQFCEFRGYCYSSQGDYIEGKIDNKSLQIETMDDTMGKRIPLEVVQGDL